MPDWNDILNEIKEAGSVQDIVRRKYLAELHKITGRNIIIYYSELKYGKEHNDLKEICK